jgi:serine phosphatase RsbU (regulator of sigma subunit)
MPVSSSSQWRSLVQRARGLASIYAPSRRVLGLMAGAGLGGGLALRLLAPAGLPGAAAWLREGLVVAGFAALWFAARPFFEKRPTRSLRALGMPILASLGVLLVAAIPWSLGLASLGGAPAPEMPGAGGVLLRHLLAWAEGGFVLLLLMELRGLVLYRRTRAAQRNWRLMLGVMSGAALTAFGLAPGHDLGALQMLPVTAAVGLMVVNSFQLSWVIGLSVREKVAGAALALGLLVASSLALAVANGAPPGPAGSNAVHTLAVYSFALDLFAIQACIFGILYSLTALLSLVFHLPTTGDMQRKRDETAALHDLAHLVDQTFDAERLSGSIARAPVEAGNADAAWLALDGAPERLVQDAVTEKGPQVVATAGDGPVPIGERVDLRALFAEARRTQEPIVIEDARSDPRAEVGPQGALASLLVVPLVARGVFAGTLLATRDVARGFAQDDVSSIQAFASQAGLALDHARLFEEQLEMERLERELDIARTVQERLLPGRLPEVEGLQIAADSTPAREVGGDYYDFARLPDGRLAFVVADVSGKGTQAAFFMAEMQGLFRSLSSLEPEPAAFLARANTALRGILDDGTFVTALYGLLDPEQGRLRLARAGHCPVALAREGDGARLLRPEGMALGMAPRPLFERALTPVSLQLHPGDTLALYTDGLVESRSAGGEEYGYDRLLGSLQQRGGEQASPAALRDGLLADLRAFTGSGNFDDDLALVVLRWRCSASPGSPASGASAARPAVSSSAGRTVPSRAG